MNFLVADQLFHSRCLPFLLKSRLITPELGGSFLSASYNSDELICKYNFPADLSIIDCFNNKNRFPSCRLFIATAGLNINICIINLIKARGFLGQSNFVIARIKRSWNQ